MTLAATAGGQAVSRPDTRLYRAVWRWHFYAGLFVAPFLVILALSGLVMLWFTTIAPEYGDRLAVTPRAAALSITDQQKVALAAHPGARITQYVAPYDSATPALFYVGEGAQSRVLAVDPYSGAVLRDRPKEGTWYEFASHVHGELLVGTDGGPGDFVIEIAASLGIIALVTGIYLWWPRTAGGWTAALVPQVAARGRVFWKSLHSSTGAWISVVLLFFLISGLAWTGVWGGRYVQAWSTFPAAKWDNVPLSDQTHASMNHGDKAEVPWAIEQTPMPASGSQLGSPGIPHGQPVDLSSVVALGRSLGFAGRFQVALPKDETGVWTLSRDSMSYDSPDATSDLTVHVDQYTGKVLATVGFADYALPGKAMAVGIALHEGQLGWWNIALNALFCIAIVLMAVSGVVMWWIRRPAGALAAPRYPRDFRIGVPVVLLALGLAIAFPLGGLAIALFALVDLALPKRWKEAGAQA